MAVRCKILKHHLGIQRWHSFIFCFDKKKKHSSDLTSLRLKNILKNLNFVFTGGEMYLQCVHSFFHKIKTLHATEYHNYSNLPCSVSNLAIAGLVFSPETRVNLWKILKILKTEFSPLKKKVA